MRYFFLLLGIAVSSLAAQSTLSGYKAVVRTTVYEDRSMSREIELNYSADEKEAAQSKRNFFQSYGYHLIERIDNDNFYLTASKIIPPDGFSDDPFSRLLLNRNDNAYNYSEDFSNHFVIQDIQNSDLKNDLATAKVLLADVEYQFVVVMPGKIVETNANQFHMDTAAWSYDIEQLLNRQNFQMHVNSTVERNDHALWSFAVIAIIVLAIAVLIKLKFRLRDATVD